MSAHVAGRHPRRLARRAHEYYGHRSNDPQCVKHRPDRHVPVRGPGRGRSCQTCADARFMLALKQFRAGGGQGLLMPGVR